MVDNLRDERTRLQEQQHFFTDVVRASPSGIVFLLLDELTEELRQAERGAYEKLIRVMAHEVNNSVAASNSLLTSSLTYGRELGSDSRDEFEHAIGIVIQRTEQLNRFMRSFADVFRLPAPARRPERVVDARRIEDSGPGLAPEAKANLFTPFFSTKPQGQRIGLTVVQEILSAQGFAYSLETPPAGRTTFTIAF